jgi:hypothetical protein
LAVGEEGVAVVVVEVPEVVLDGVLAGVAVEGGAGVVEVIAVDFSDVLGAISFFSPVVGVGASLPADGFILSE